MRNIFLTLCLAIFFNISSIFSQCLGPLVDNPGVTLENGEAYLTWEDIFEYKDPNCELLMALGDSTSFDSIYVDCSKVGTHYLLVDANSPEYPQVFLITINPDEACTGINPSEYYILQIQDVYEINAPLEVKLNGNTLENPYELIYSIPKYNILSGDNKIEFFGQNPTVNGVSTLDLVLINRFLFELTIPTPMEALRSDIDKSGFIGVNDMLVLRKLVLGISNDNEYRFIHENQEFPSDFDPFDFGVDYYDYHFEGSEADQINFLFVPYVAGDVNNTAKFGEKDSGTRSSVILSYDDISVKKDQEYEVTFETQNIGNIAGISADLAFEGVSYINDSNSYSPLEWMGVSLDNKDYRFNYLNTSSDQKSLQFTINVVAERDGMLSEMIALNPEFNNELIDEFLNSFSVSLIANQVLGAYESELEDLKIYPNPVSDFVSIQLPVNDIYHVTITDVLGKSVFQKSLSGNSLEIHKSEIGHSGCYFVIVENNDRRFVQKLIIE